MNKKDLLGGLYLENACKDFIDKLFIFIDDDESEEVRRAFMSGALTVYQACVEYPDDMNDEEIVESIVLMRRELKAMIDGERRKLETRKDLS